MLAPTWSQSPLAGDGNSLRGQTAVAVGGLVGCLLADLCGRIVGTLRG